MKSHRRKSSRLVSFSKKERIAQNVPGFPPEDFLTIVSDLPFIMLVVLISS